MKAVCQAKTFTLKNGCQITTREACATDAKSLIEYMHQVSAESDNIGWGAGEFNISLEEEENILASRVNDPHKILLLALYNGEVVCTCGLDGKNRPRMRHSTSLGITVRKSHWGVGLGRIMMNELINWARSTGFITQIELSVRTSNLRAVQLYLTCGFEFQHRITRDLLIGGDYVDCYAMRLLLQP
ncbi:GNAT family N-acetyltransferase [Candidatus Peregrinibacteria bacterium]|nr:GNAT family N-acetyltransferase [Candidatus Peregrinibacteria bacterium]